MKKIANALYWLVLIPVLLLASCGEEGGLKGVLKISITDAPTDAYDIKSVNLVIRNIEGLQNGQWKTFRNFETPAGLNLLNFTGGKAALMVDQYVTPGEYTALRLSLNMANRNTSLIINPQSSIVFKNGSSKPIYMKEANEPEIVIQENFGISSRGLTDLVIDIDARKSILLNAQGEYELKPSVRFLHTHETGHINLDIINTSLPDGVVAYVYKQGSFSVNDAMPNEDGLSFVQAITSTSIRSEKSGFGFLLSGGYEIVFVRHGISGGVMEFLGKISGANVTKGEALEVTVDLEQLSPV